MKKIVLITGGFDPIHSGHLAYIQAAMTLGDILVVGVNSDEWLTRKKGRSFMPLIERCTILRAIKGVDYVITFNDADGSAQDAIKMTRDSYPQHKIIFANGGDRTTNNIPEMALADANLEFVFGVGGADKTNSSSWILEEWKAPRTTRQWGYYRVLHATPGVKVKELTVDPGASLSMQRHQQRAEFWLVAAGEATVYTLDQSSTDMELRGRYGVHEYLHIPTYDWHQLVNEDPNPLKIVEIQYGHQCEELDIERKLAL
jgi:D-beta-D-heptose 7-phosphate kinase/D-beta-D-heptose 1-phosphate adenosyltransferase